MRTLPRRIHPSLVHPNMQLIALLVLLLVFLALRTAAAAGEPLQPLPSATQLSGTLVFHGHYHHRSRGGDITTPTEVWINQLPGGAITALAEVPFMGTTELVVGDATNRPREHHVRRSASDAKPAYGMDLKFPDGKVLLTRRGIRQDCDDKLLTVPAAAIYDPNSRPDSYLAANVILRAAKDLKTSESKEFYAFDWDNSGEAMAMYSFRLEARGKEQVQVPAGSFQANHIVLTQTSSGDTWYKKRAGHTTDFWILDNGIIVRILRAREPYEVLLQDYDTPKS